MGGRCFVNDAIIFGGSSNFCRLVSKRRQAASVFLVVYTFGGICERQNVSVSAVREVVGSGAMGTLNSDISHRGLRLRCHSDSGVLMGVTSGLSEPRGLVNSTNQLFGTCRATVSFLGRRFGGRASRASLGGFFICLCHGLGFVRVRAPRVGSTLGVFRAVGRENINLGPVSLLGGLLFERISEGSFGSLGDG